MRYKNDKRDRLRKVVGLMTKKVMREYQDEESQSSPNSSLNEYGASVATEVIRELVDDLILTTEMHIQENYGSMDAKQFREQWTKSISQIERKIQNTLKNMSKG